MSGICPHPAMFNDENECGVGAVVPRADRLWVITDGPHMPLGSSDKLHEITPDLAQIVRPESLGGTPANRMLHRESNPLIIGPCLVDAQRTVRAIPCPRRPGRLTGNARHLVDPASKVDFATMAEELYAVDIRTLEVRGLVRGGNFAAPLPTETPPAAFGLKAARLPRQGAGVRAGPCGNVRDPPIPIGALAEWTGAGDWRLVRRNQFTEVAGPGGLKGHANPDTDPMWSTEWDPRSMILMRPDRGTWRAYRLPMASHCCDGSRGWTPSGRASATSA